MVIEAHLAHQHLAEAAADAEGEGEGEAGCLCDNRSHAGRINLGCQVQSI